MSERPIALTQQMHTNNLCILLILIQEPHTNYFNSIIMSPNFRPVFPSNRVISQDTIRAVIWVNRNIDTSQWITLDIPNTNDISAIQIKNNQGVISIFNIYNNCTHSRNKNILKTYIENNCNKILAMANHQMIWEGNFNRHHPLWDNNKDTRLFTQQALNQASNLIELIATYELNMPLPKRHTHPTTYGHQKSIPIQTISLLLMAF